MRRVLLAVVFIAGGTLSRAEPGSGFDQAVDLARQGQAAAAAAMFADLSHVGNRAAQVNLAVMQARGQGLPQDDQAAAYWAWRARLAGETRAIPLSDLLLERLTDTARRKLADRLTADLIALAELGADGNFAALGRVEAQLRSPPRLEEAAVWFTIGAAFEESGAVPLREVVVGGLDAAARLGVQERAREAFTLWCAKLDSASRPPTCDAN